MDQIQEMHEHQKEIRQEHRQQQQKYVYYIIALSVAALGFSFHQTTGHPVKFIQIPLAIAIGSWSISIFFGFLFIEGSIEILSHNYNFNEFIKELRANGSPVNGSTYNDTLLKISAPKIKKVARKSKAQIVLFYIGVLSFIVWHVLEMIVISNIHQNMIVK